MSKVYIEDDDSEYYENITYAKKKIQMIENQIKGKPKEKEYRNLISLLRDFGIHIKRESIPDFATLGEMERWQRNVIRLALRG